MTLLPAVNLTEWTTLVPSFASLPALPALPSLPSLPALPAFTSEPPVKEHHIPSAVTSQVKNMTHIHSALTLHSWSWTHSRDSHSHLIQISLFFAVWTAIPWIPIQATFYALWCSWAETKFPAFYVMTPTLSLREEVVYWYPTEVVTIATKDDSRYWFYVPNG